MQMLLPAAAVLGLIARDIHFSGPVNRIDHEIQGFLLTELSQPLTQVMFVISWLGGVGIGYVAGLLVLMLLLQREWTWLLSLGVTMGAHVRLTILLKALVHRPRPQIDHPILVAQTPVSPVGMRWRPRCCMDGWRCMPSIPFTKNRGESVRCRDAARWFCSSL
jgi:hypothetical protein